MYSHTYEHFNVNIYRCLICNKQFHVNDIVYKNERWDQTGNKPWMICCSYDHAEEYHYNNFIPEIIKNIRILVDNALITFVKDDDDYKISKKYISQEKVQTKILNKIEKVLYKNDIF